MKKIIEIPEEMLPDFAKVASKEKRRGKRDIKNFIEDLVISYVEKNK